MRSTLTTPVAECTVPEKILLAAAALEEQGQAPFSAEALIVAVWQRYPRTFGLKGFAELYPDSNKVLSSIMGAKGLAGRGWLAKVGQKLYNLTRDGRHVVRRIQTGDDTPLPPPPPPEAPRLTREQERFLAALWSAAAFEKYQEGRRPELTFADACGFWGIGDSVRGPAVDARLDLVRTTFADLERLLTGGDATLGSGRAVGLDDIGLLVDVNTYLTDKFGRHLSLLRSRAGRG